MCVIKFLNWSFWVCFYPFGALSLFGYVLMLSVWIEMLYLFSEDVGVVITRWV